MIDGIVYHVKGAKENKSEFKIEISTNNRLKFKFVWYVTSESKCKNHKSEKELEDFAREIEEHPYSMFPSNESNTENCQSFALKMLAYAAELTEEEAKWHIWRAVGNALA